MLPFTGLYTNGTTTPPPTTTVTPPPTTTVEPINGKLNNKYFYITWGDAYLMVEIFSSLPPVICPQHLDYMSSVVDVLLETGSA